MDSRGRAITEMIKYTALTIFVYYVETHNCQFFYQSIL